MKPLSTEKIRADFPILGREIRPGVPLVYLDSAATAQKPDIVLRAMDDYYRAHNANIHRGVHTLAEEATTAYEAARKKVAGFIGAASTREIVYTRNATEAINLVAATWGRTNLKTGDLVILTEMEHHSNLVPWQMLAAELNLRLEFITVTPEGVLDLDSYREFLREEPKLVAFSHMSNVLGTINPAEEIIAMAHQAGAITLVDAAQSVPHLPINIRQLDTEFLAFSAHKMCGPTGIGILYGKKAILESMTPYMGGGDMIKRVHLRKFVANDLPYKFEAGTPAIAEAVGLGTAVDYLGNIGMEAVAGHERELISYALERLEEIPGIKVFGPSADKKGGAASFTMDSIHPHDVAQILDRDGIAVRAPNHCAMPLHDKFHIPATTRASFYLYNTRDEIDQLVNAIYKVKQLFG